MSIAAAFILATFLAQSQEVDKAGKPPASQHSGGERGTTGTVSGGKGKSAGSNTSPAAGASTKTPPPPRGAPSGPPGRRGATQRGSGDAVTQDTDRASQSATAENSSGGPGLPPDTRGKANAKRSPDAGATTR